MEGYHSRTIPLCPFRLENKFDCVYLAVPELNDPDVEHYKLSLAIEALYKTQKKEVNHQDSMSVSKVNLPVAPAFYICTHKDCRSRNSDEYCFWSQEEMKKHIDIAHTGKRTHLANFKDSVVIVETDFDSSGVGTSASSNSNPATTSISSNGCSTTSSTTVKSLPTVPTNTGKKTNKENHHVVCMKHGVRGRNFPNHTVVPAKTNKHPANKGRRSVSAQTKPSAKIKGGALPFFVNKLNQANATKSWTVECEFGKCKTVFSNMEEVVEHFKIEHRIHRKLHFDFIPTPVCNLCHETDTDFQENPSSFWKHVFACTEKYNNKYMKELKPKEYPIPNLSETGKSNLPNTWFGQIFLAGSPIQDRPRPRFRRSPSTVRARAPSRQGRPAGQQSVTSDLVVAENISRAKKSGVDSDIDPTLSGGRYSNTGSIGNDQVKSTPAVRVKSSAQKNIVSGHVSRKAKHDSSKSQNAGSRKESEDQMGVVPGRVNGTQKKRRHSESSRQCNPNKRINARREPLGPCFPSEITCIETEGQQMAFHSPTSDTAEQQVKLLQTNSCNSASVDGVFTSTPGPCQPGRMLLRANVRQNVDPSN